MALLSIGVRVHVLAAESDPLARAVTTKNIDQVTFVDYVEDIAPDLFGKILDKRGIKAVLVGGGSPCQANTSLNRQRCKTDMRSMQPQEISRIAQDMKAAYPAIPVLTFLENVASMPAATADAYTELMDTPF